MATNLDSSTRELWLKTLKWQVIMALPLFNALYTRRKVVWQGGTKIKRTVGMATMESLAQNYSANDPLISSDKTLLDRPEFAWKRKQVPIEYDCDVEIQNMNPSDGRVIDLVKELVAAGQKGARLSCRTDIHAAYSATSDSDADVQGIADALAHDSTTYGTIARSTTSKTWWMGATVDGTWADYSDAGNCEIHMLREMRRASAPYADRKPSDLLVLVSPTNFVGLQSEMETRMLYRTDGNLAKQGFNAMTLDGYEIVEDPYLDSDSTKKNYVSMLHLPDWEFRIDPGRSFELRPFVWQGDVVNGYDKYLARVMFAGNLVCWQPNASCYRSNLSV